MESQQGVVAEGVGIHHVSLESWSGSVLPPAMVSCHPDEVSEHFPAFFVLSRIITDEQGDDESETSLP